MSKKYTIEVSEEQMNLLSMACEFTSRFICGQTDTSCWPVAALHNKVMDINDPSWQERRDEADVLMSKLKLVVWKMEGGHYGIHFNDKSDALWDMYQVFRHEMWKQDSEENRALMAYTNQSYPAHKVSKEPLPVVQVIDETK